MMGSPLRGEAELGLIVANALEGASALHERDCAGVIWDRPAPGFTAWLDALPPERLPNGRMVVAAAAIRDEVARLCAEAQTPEGLELAELREDIGHLANMFSALMGSRHLRMRLDRVATDSCSRFHVDAVKARLVCSYRGPGTQYRASANGDAPGEIFTVPTGAPILLRGSLWPAQGAASLVHRSPPINGTGTTRLVLVLDVAE